ncbi:MAG: type II toxin-antitoxin system Phd/YefM family antitoxin [Acidobacteriota bacterium]|jgi:prevent-host-death family protein
MSTRTYRNRAGELVEMMEISATRAKNTFGEVLDRLSAVGAISITRHDKPKAVLLSHEEFEALRRERSETLDELSARFDHLLEQMQTPAARRGMEAAFDAPPEELGRVAVEQARHERDD